MLEARKHGQKVEQAVYDRLHPYELRAILRLIAGLLMVAADDVTPPASITALPS
jgi:hypothetical protein